MSCSTTNTTYVSDFGLARQTDEDSSLTVSQALIGTPAYLPPEVAIGGGRQATVAADIYGLGAILYQLLTGQTLFAGATIAETLRAVQDNEPTKPRRLNPAVPSDLETICLKCLEKEPEKRYSTAPALAGDLSRFLRDEPIQARPVTRAERVWRWCRRKPALAGALGTAAVLLLAMLIGSPIALWRIDYERQRAEKGESDARQKAYASDMNRALQAFQADEFDQTLQLLDQHRPKVKSGIRNPKSEVDLRGWEWRYLWRRCQGEQRFILGEHIDGASAIGMLADGKTVFSAGNDKVVRLWDLDSRRPIGLLSHPEAIIGAAASPDGRWLATAMAKEAEGQPVLLWDLASRQIAAKLITSTPQFTNFWLRPQGITFSPDSKWLAVATMWGGVRLWNVDARSEVAPLPSTNNISFLIGLAFSPDSRTLACNENDFGAISLWDIASHSATRLTGHESVISALAFSPDGQTLASGSLDRTVRLWNLAERREEFPSLTDRSGGITSLAFSADGRTLAMAGEGGAGRVIRLVDVETGSPKAELRGHLENVSELAFTPDGKTLLSASADGTLRVWDSVPRASQQSAHLFARNLISIAWGNCGPALFLSPDGRHLLTIYSNETFAIWDTLRLAEGARHPLPFTNTTMASVAPGGRLAAFGSRGGELMLWDVEASQPRPISQPGMGRIHRLVFSPDGRYLAAVDDFKLLSEMAGSNDDPRRTVRVWDVATQKLSHVVSPDGQFLFSVAFSADSKALIAGDWRGLVKLWTLDGPAEVSRFKGHSGTVHGLASLPGGHTLISAGSDIRFWDVRTCRETGKLNSRKGGFISLSLSPDGSRLAAGGSDGRITIYDFVSREERATLEGHQEQVRQLAFTPDGDHLVSASRDQFRVWSAASWAETETPDKRVGK